LRQLFARLLRHHVCGVPVWPVRIALPDTEDLDDPAAFIDRVIGGDTSGIDEAIAEFERGTDPGPADPDGGAGSVDS
jgi:hypothetical protein